MTPQQPKSILAALRRGLNRLWSFFRKGPLDDDLNEEMAAHIDLATEEKMRSGLSRVEARRQAMIQFGGIMQAKENQRATRGIPSLDILVQDLTYSWRTLRRDTSFTMIAVIILAIGIGANISVFSVVNTILFRPLPFRDPDQLVRMGPITGNKGGMSTATYSSDAYEVFASKTKTLRDVMGYFAFSDRDNVRLNRGGTPLPVSMIMVTGNFFKALGVEPSLGRLFTAEESQKNARPVTLLSYPFWQRQFGADPNIIGRAISFGNTPVTVVGVLPENFDFGAVFEPGAKIDLFTPVNMDEIREEGNTLALFGRLQPNATLQQAQGEVNLLFPDLPGSLKHPEWKPGYTAGVQTLKDYVSGKLRRSLIVVWIAVGLILLIVCVNLSNLLLARAATRRKEFALRSALGAGRGRIIRQLLTESIVLSFTGAILGLGLAYVTTYYLAHKGSVALPLLGSIRVDGTALVWTLLITMATALVFGLIPAFRTTGKNLQEDLKDTGQGVSEGRSHDFLRSFLVISEVSLACVLLVGAGLLLRSFLQVMDVDLGFSPSQAAAIKVDYNDGNNADKKVAIFQEMQRRIEALPGVESAGISDNLPLDRNRSWDISAKGVQYPRGLLQATFVYIVSPGYLHSIGMRLAAGRDFTWADGPKDEKVVIINQTVARKLWPGQNPIGRIASAGGDDARVIGVIDDVQTDTIEGESGWQMYMPLSQQGNDGAQLVVRTKLPPAALASSVMTTLRSMNPAQPATEFRPLQRLVDRAVSPRRFFVLLVAFFAVLGVVLASLGIYGVISYSVTQRTKEIGIRMALGATAERVQFDVISRTLRLAFIGIVVGTVFSFITSRLIASLLFGTRPTDPITFVGMVVLLGSMALFAGYIPARRASRIEPMDALRLN
ncbi:ABC transporter permease [Acidicapsa ligni]|uniref:ABC transporter permease n=1 Tax=Acidicapsa ligni TaxID=542300 RepID=UPI0021E0C64A|nr:ABC transporter permease [Acidicapsa ligni]